MWVIESRRAIVCFFIIATIIATAVAVCTGSLVGPVAQFPHVTMSGPAIIILLGHFWKQATWQGAVTALAVTPAVSLALMFSFGHSRLGTNPTIPASVAGTLAQIGVSLITWHEKPRFDEIEERIAPERNAPEGEPSDVALSRSSCPAFGNPPKISARRR